MFVMEISCAKHTRDGHQRRQSTEEWPAEERPRTSDSVLHVVGLATVGVQKVERRAILEYEYNKQMRSEKRVKEQSGKSAILGEGNKSRGEKMRQPLP